ncbi:MAG: OmpH family outer membrane protein [bacterium]|nr:OmpH family outer membrane protein [bacterium]
MLTRITTLITLVIALAVATPAFAQNLKIGLVNFQQALNDVEEGKRAKANLKSQFESKQQALNAKQEGLKRLKEEIEAKRAALSADAMRQKEAQYRDQFLDLQKTLAQFRQEMATKEAEVTQGIVEKLKKTVERIGKSEGYTIIFEKSQDTVLFANGATDLTAKVISAYNSGK